MQQRIILIQTLDVILKNVIYIKGMALYTSIDSIDKVIGLGSNVDAFHCPRLGSLSPPVRKSITSDERRTCAVFIISRMMRAESDKPSLLSTLLGGDEAKMAIASTSGLLGHLGCDLEGNCGAREDCAVVFL